MTPLPKPARRGPKPRKPIRRSKSIRSAKPRKAQRQAHEADALWSRLVRGRSALCERCWWAIPTHAHHLISRRVRATRWALHNGAALCFECHDACHRGAGYALRNARLAVDLLGPKGWLELCERASRPSRVSTTDALQALLAEAAAREVSRA